MPKKNVPAKSKGGRPKSPDSQDDDIRVRCRSTDKRRWEKAAKVAGIAFPQWVRDVLDSAAKP